MKMDLHPTFGHQELLETLSQGSAGSSRAGNQKGRTGATTTSSHHSSAGVSLAGSHSGVSLLSGAGASASSRTGNHQQQHQQPKLPPGGLATAGAGGSMGGHRASANTSHSSQQHPLQQQQQQQNVDEAYRRLGKRLSMQAHGDMRVPPTGPKNKILPISITCSFEKYTATPRAILPEEEDDDDENDIDTRGASAAVAALATAAAGGTGAINAPAAGGQQQQPMDSAVPQPQQPGNTTISESRFRTSKVAKTRYSDHGEHHQQSPLTSGTAASSTASNHTNSNNSNKQRTGSILKKLTYEAKDLFQRWEQANLEEILSRKKSSSDRTDSSSISPQRYAFSQLALEQQQQLQQQQQQQPQVQSQQGSAEAATAGASHPQQQQQQTPRRRQHHLHHHAQQQQQQQHHQQQHDQVSWGQAGTGMLGPSSKGLLPAVLEGQCDSASVASGSIQAPSPSCQSISTKGSKTISSSGGGGGGAGGLHGAGGAGAATAVTGAVSAAGSMAELMAAAPRPALTRGRCLTTPSEAVANEGRDNIEGNLIVFERDVIVVPRKSIHTVHPVILGQEQQQRSAEYRIQSLLGQGTFAQVFQCLHVQTGQMVALKIVKNKPAYTRQATVEIDVFRALQEENRSGEATSITYADNRDYRVNLICYFMHRSHLCLVFELLGLNLYEVLKRRQFRGLPLSMVRTIVQQAVEGIKDLAQRNIVHCDLKPENVLLVSDEVVKNVIAAGEERVMSNTEMSLKKSPTSTDISAGTSLGSSSKGASADHSSGSSSGAVTVQIGNLPESLPPRKKAPARRIKLIDFGSACFEGYTAHTYIQSRFYRSPEVLIGLPYDSAIDMWSLGCVAAELFLGLPILPGVHEHDQLGRIHEMIANIPETMLDQGSKTTKYYVKFVPRASSQVEPSAMNREPSPAEPSSGSAAPLLPQWRIKTQQEYISSLSQSEIQKKGGLTKLEKQPGNRYFKRKKLSDILILHAQSSRGEDKELLPAFVHFLYGLLDPDPWKRWTAFQAIQHPFVTGDLNQLKLKTSNMQLDPKETNHANLQLDVFWQAPWDPAICRRKLLNVQKLREKQNSMRKNLAHSSRPSSQGSDFSMNSQSRLSRRGEPPSPTNMATKSLIPESPSYAQGQLSNDWSPSNQVSTSGSNSSHLSQQLQNQYGLSATGSSDNLSMFMNSSSYAGLGQGGSRAQMALGTSIAGRNVADQSMFNMAMGPQSLTGTNYEAMRNPIEGDFALALQRPGVVPGASSVSSHTVPFQSGMAHSAYGSYVQGPGLNERGSSMPNQSSMSLPHNTIQGSQSLAVAPKLPTSSSYSNLLSSSMGSASGQQGDLHYGMGSISAASSVSMADSSANLAYPQSGGYLDSQRQMAMLQQQAHHQTAMPQQPPPQQQFGEQQQRFAQPMEPYGQMKFDQQLLLSQQFGQVPGGQQQFGFQQQPMQINQPQQQFAFQQQPIFLAQAGNPGGGYYYVTTSATGQPIILQPVAMLNQPTMPNAYGGGDMSMQGPAYAMPSQYVQQQQYPQAGQYIPPYATGSLDNDVNYGGFNQSFQDQTIRGPQQQQQHPQPSSRKNTNRTRHYNGDYGGGTSM